MRRNGTNKIKRIMYKGDSYCPSSTGRLVLLL